MTCCSPVGNESNRNGWLGHDQRTRRNERLLVRGGSWVRLEPPSFLRQAYLNSEWYLSYRSNDVHTSFRQYEFLETLLVASMRNDHSIKCILSSTCSYQLTFHLSD